LFVKDKDSGKTAKVVLDETAPDSSTFKGNFSLGWAEDAKTQPEIYIPPQNLVGQKGMEKFKTMLRSGKLKRKPVVFHTDNDGRQLVDVYDTKEQAVKAFKAFKEEQKIAEREKQAKKLLKQAKTDKATLEVAAMAERQKELKRLELEGAKRESARVRLEQLERQKAEERLRKQQALAQEERDRRKAEALKLGEQGMQKFIGNDFEGASDLFSQAVELDPENRDYNLNHGIALYRQKKYDEALVKLNVAPDKPERVAEKRYYLGLCHYNLKELEPAIKDFSFVRDQNSKDFSASAAFYLGLLHMTKEDFKLAEENFQWVLDNSTDPQLDEQAEKYIESLASLKQFAEKRKKPFTLSGILGLMYDSNVLLIPSGAAEQDATGSEVGDVRLVASGSLAYRGVYSKKHEFTPTVFSYMLRSQKNEVSQADPFLNSVALPYTFKGTAWDKGYKLTVKPSYEVINMDVNEDGAQEMIISSAVVNTDNTFVMSKDWIQSVIFEYRQDDSSIESATGDDDLDATKMTLKSKHINFLDKSRKRLLTSYAAVILNDAVGKNRTYQRFDLSSTYMRPMNWWKSNWTFGLTVYQISFNENANDRVDVNYNLATGLSRPINKWLNWSLNAAYIQNNSTVDSFTYSRYTLTSNFIATTDF
jgi:tetratricopeptide (TPR) repeat protein